MDTADRYWRQLPAVRGRERLVWSFWERHTFPGRGKFGHQWTRLQGISKRVGPSDRQIPMAAWNSWRGRSRIGIFEWPCHRRSGSRARGTRRIELNAPLQLYNELVALCSTNRSEWPDIHRADG